MSPRARIDPRRRVLRAALRPVRRALALLDAPWRHLVVAAITGVLGALAVHAFRLALFGLEAIFVGARDGHLVAAARHLAPEVRVLAPALGAFAAGLLLWVSERGRAPEPARHRGDYIEAVVIGDGRLDVRAGLLKAAASLLVVSTGGAVGREGAMVLLAALLASALGRGLGRTVDLRLVVSCGAAAGLAAAYQAPLAGAVFVAEILLGSLALAQLGPVVVAAVMSYGVTVAMGERSVLFAVPAAAAPQALQVAAMMALALLGGVAGAALLSWLQAARAAFVRSRLPLPAAFALGGLVVGLLSLWRPEVWGNGYSSIELQLTAPAAWMAVAIVLALKLLAIGATTGSGAPGGVFTPTLFVGAAAGALAAAALAALGVSSVAEPVYALVGMAIVLAATTRAPVMSALMVVEMTGQYVLLPVLLPATVLATLVSQRLHPQSVYGLGRDAREPGAMTSAR